MTGAPLLLAPSVARTVLDHSLEAAPDECCGIMVGPDASTATEAIRTENAHERPRSEYEVPPDALLTAVERTEKEGSQIVGFYHSHPRGAAAFSRTDRARGSWEGGAYLLCSLAPLAFRAGRWDGERFLDLDVHIGSTDR